MAEFERSPDLGPWDESDQLFRPRESYHQPYGDMHHVSQIPHSKTSIAELQGSSRHTRRDGSKPAMFAHDTQLYSKLLAVHQALNKKLHAGSPEPQNHEANREQNHSHPMRPTDLVIPGQATSEAIETKTRGQTQPQSRRQDDVEHQPSQHTGKLTPTRDRTWGSEKLESLRSQLAELNSLVPESIDHILAEYPEPQPQPQRSPYRSRTDHGGAGHTGLDGSVAMEVVHDGEDVESGEEEHDRGHALVDRDDSDSRRHARIPGSDSADELQSDFTLSRSPEDPTHPAGRLDSTDSEGPGHRSHPLSASELSTADNTSHDHLVRQQRLLAQLVAERDGTIEQQTKEIESLKSDISRFETTLNRLEAEKEEAAKAWEKERAELEQKLSNAEVKVVAAESERDSMNEMLENAQWDSNDDKKQLVELKEALEEKTSSLEAVMGENETLLARVDDLKNEAAAMASEISRLQQAADDAEAELVEVQSLQAEMLQARTSLSERLKKAEEMLSDERDTAARRAEQEEAMQARLIELRAQLQDAQDKASDRDVMEADYTALQAHCEDLESRVDELGDQTSALAELSRKATLYAQERDSSRQAAANEKKRADKLEFRLQNEQRELVAELNTLREVKNALQSELLRRKGTQAAMSLDDSPAIPTNRPRVATPEDKGQLAKALARNLRQLRDVQNFLQPHDLGR
ncbi:Chromosome partition protein Smc [Carpediemonas membranifera]|uniref:Chromosome partition protein Smc n=1 Tax=Carpediemonas membranifera TaxID=201153 RepID=A0A8J6AV80_9EUKA|nr:Chromosome partition protein Smc [Carpediemonas membranifera]|eukprot:KAG9395626.1 Chromosome partition protein Smc [Carpediemonas membranifera]